MNSKFDEWSTNFSQFLAENGYPESVHWITAGDILLTGRRQIYVKLPIPDDNEAQVRQLFESGASERWGILLQAIGEVQGKTLACAWSPRNAEEAEGVLIGKGVKMSAMTAESKTRLKAVSSPLRWRYLVWKLRAKQQQRHLLVPVR